MLRDAYVPRQGCSIQLPEFLEPFLEHKLSFRIEVLNLRDEQGPGINPVSSFARTVPVDQNKLVILDNKAVRVVAITGKEAPACEEIQNFIERQIDPEHAVEIGRTHRSGDELVLQTVIEQEIGSRQENRSDMNAEGAFYLHQYRVGLCSINSNEPD